MHNQYLDLSQALAEQRITEWHEQVTHARLGRGSRQRPLRVARGWWQLARRPAVAVEQPVRYPQHAS